MAGKKIGELTPLGRNLIATDELELSLAGSAGSRKITGAEIIGASGGGYVPYTGATQSVNLGTYNLSANNLFDGFSSIVASGTLVTLTINSVPSYVVTGSGGQVIKLPDATTLPNGAAYFFNNNQSSGAISVNNNSNTLVASIPSGGFSQITLLSNSTAAGSWERHEQAPSNVTWSTNTFDYAGSITSATWNGVAIADNRISSSAVWNAKQDALVSGTNIKTINSTSLLGSGNVSVQPTLVSGTNIKTVNSTSLLGSGDVSVGVTSVTGTAPISSTGGATPAISIATATTSTTGALTSTDWNTFNGKQVALVSGTNIKTINSTSLLGSGDLVIGGLPAWVETNATDLTIWNNGQGNVVSNTSFGDGALKSNTTGSNNTALGYNALDANTTGIQNTAIGSQALGALTNGTANTSVGYNSLLLNTGSNNTSIGAFSMDANTTGGTNTALGFDTLGSNTTGSGNTAIGNNALATNQTASNNTAVGYNALTANTTGTQNTAIGVGALGSNTTTSNSTAVGYNALRVSTGGSNVAIGTNALGSNTTAVDNVAVGNGALISNTTGTNNTAIGNTALASNISGTLNTAVGYGALLFNDDTSNTAIGYNALRVSTTGVVNTAIGYNAAPSHTTGIRNVFIGGNSGAFNTTGNNNTVIGNDTSTGNFSSCTILGRGATATANNQFVVGSAGVNAGTITTETLPSTRTWSVIINGTAYKILLA